MARTDNNTENLDRDELIKLVGRQTRLMERLQARVSQLEAKLGEKNLTERLDQPYLSEKRSEAQREAQSEARQEAEVAQTSRKTIQRRLDQEGKPRRSRLPRGRFPRGLSLVAHPGGLATRARQSRLGRLRNLSRRQAVRLLNQIARAWEPEFESLWAILANSAIVHCDETSWSINRVWTFLNENVTVAFYGVHKDGQTLASILNKELFKGTLVSDDTAVYQGFSEAQKCWAHLLRKAIKLTLTSPDEPRYRELADGLLDIYRDSFELMSSKKDQNRLGFTLR